MIGRGEHDEVAEGALVEFPAIKEIDPLADDGATRGVGDTGEALASRELGQDFLGDGEGHAASDVIDGDLVRKAHIFRQMQMGDLDIERGGCVPLQSGGQAAVGAGAGDAPSVDKDDVHGG